MSDSWADANESWLSAGLTIPQGGMMCTASILGQTCKVTSTPAGPVTVSGTWSNTTSSITLTSQSVPVQTSGGFPCPSATSKTITTIYTKNPFLTITAN